MKPILTIELLIEKSNYNETCLHEVYFFKFTSLIQWSESTLIPVIKNSKFESEIGGMNRKKSIFEQKIGMNGILSAVLKNFCQLGIHQCHSKSVHFFTKSQFCENFLRL
jgi:hypothetical protein